MKKLSPVEVTNSAIEAKEIIDKLVKSDAFPKLTPVLSNAKEQLESLTKTESADGLESSVSRIYQTTMADVNVAPTKYQQKVFQCYGDYEQCIKTKTDGDAKTICSVLFILAVASSLLSVSIELK